jgi:hypothetical protein
MHAHYLGLLYILVRAHPSYDPKAFLCDGGTQD